MKLTLSKKLYGVVGGALLVLLLVSVMSYFMQRSVVSGYEEVIKTDFKQLEHSMDAQIGAGQSVQSFNNLLVRRDEKYAQEFKENIEAIRKEIKGFESLADEEDKKLVNASYAELDIYASSLDKLKEVLRNGKEKDVAAIDNMFKGVVKPLVAALNKMDEAAMKSSEKAQRRISGRASTLSAALGVISIVAIILLLGVSVMIIRAVLKSVGATADVVGKVSQGDLTRDVPVTSSDEIGEMATGFNDMMGSLRDIATKVTDMTSTLASNSEQVSATTAQITAGINDQFLQIEQSATATTEVSQTIMDVAKNAAEASNAAKESVEIAAGGKKVVEDTVSGMVSIAKKVEDSANTIEELGKSSQQIGEIVNVIKDIADQTNLLALNAAIEAARAGEQGRGFAVVADEVRKLAERTSKATGEISSMITKIQNDTEVSVRSMAEGRESAEEGVKLAEKAKESLDRIVGASERCMDMVRMIATAAEEQSTAIEEVSTTMENISGVSKTSQTAIAQINDATNQLSQLASDLKGVMEWFKVA